MSKLKIRPATPTDVPVLFELIQALAEYEKLSHLVTGTVDALQDHLFGAKPYVEAILAEYEGQTVGFALFFSNYSTFLTKPGIYIEDFVRAPGISASGYRESLANLYCPTSVRTGLWALRVVSTGLE